MYSYQPCMHITKQLLIRCILIARIVNKKNNLINYINFSLMFLIVYSEVRGAL